MAAELCLYETTVAGAGVPPTNAVDTDICEGNSEVNEEYTTVAAGTVEVLDADTRECVSGTAGG